MPPICNSIPATPVPVVWSVAMACSFLMLFPCARFGIEVFASGMSGAVVAHTGGRVNHQRCSANFAVDLEVQEQQVPTGRRSGRLEHDLRTRGIADLGRSEEHTSELQSRF